MESPESTHLAAWSTIVSQATHKPQQIDRALAWTTNSSAKRSSCVDPSAGASQRLKTPCETQSSMQYSVMGVTGFLASFMQTAWAGERALGGATLIGGELVGIPVDDHGVDSSNNKKDDDTPADTAAVSTHAGLLRHCISEPQPCRVLRNLSTGSGRSASPSSLAPTSSPPAAGSITKPRSLEGNSGWLLLDPDAATAAFGGLTLVGGELHGVAADGDDAITVTITVKKLKGAKAD